MENRLEKLKKIFSRTSLDAILISSVPNIIYLTEFNYFSTEERDAYLLITKNRNYILTTPLYSHAVKQKVRHFDLLEMNREQQLEQILARVVEKEQIHSLGIEANNVTVFEYQKFAKIFKKIENINLDKLRMIKDKTEIESIETACKIGDAAFSHIQTSIQEGISEKELAFALESLIREQNADLAFRSIVAFGENSAVPHHLPQNRKLKRGDVVLLDFGVKYKNYCSDMTRTLVFCSASEKHRQVYQTVLEAQEKAVEQVGNATMKQFNNGISAKAVGQAAQEFITSQGFPPIPHSLGHGIGLEVHEYPRLSPPSQSQLQEGMVFSIEPGIYLPDEFGVRIEDLFVLEKDGLRQLTHADSTLHCIN